MNAFSATYEAVPRYRRQPRAVLRAQLRSAGLQILAAGERVSVQRLREYGVRGGTAQLIAMREEMVAAGELPPQAAARIYAHSLHPPGRKLSVDSCQLSSKLSVDSSQLSVGEGFSSPTTDNRRAGPPQGWVRRVGSQPDKQLTTPRPKLSRAQRQSRRLIREYNSAARNIFGRERAREIGAAP
jgi:hypothetical protein